MNSTAPYTVTGITSRAFHILMWCLVSAAILGNIFVFIWRFSRKESRVSLLSLLIISLAFADLLWCCHYLLAEIMAINPIFRATRNETFSFTEVDKRLCFSSAFLGYASCNAIMLTIVAISLHSLFTIRHTRHGGPAVIIFVLISWIASVAVASSATRDMKQMFGLSETTKLDAALYSLVAFFGCVAPDKPGFVRYPVIVTSVNALSSLFCPVVYLIVWWTIKKNGLILGQHGSHELKQLQLRLVIISGLNLLCWWPACILYWYRYVTDNSVFNGRLSPEATMPTFIFTAVASAANPIIYTMASKSVSRHANVCCLCCIDRGENMPNLPAVPGHKISEPRCCSFAPCIRFFEFRRKSVFRLRRLLTFSEKTDGTDLFPESQIKEQARVV